MGCLVFVSHRTRDLQTTKRMVDVLRAALHLTRTEVLFTGQIALAPKADVDDTLVRELHASKVVIGLFTRASKGSVYQIMELGAAWFAEKLIVSVVESRDVGRLPQPLVGNQAVPLDDPLLVDGLIETIGTSIGRTPAAPDAYKKEMARLLFWTRRVEPFRRHARTAALTLTSALAAMLFLSFLLSRQNVDGEVHTLDQVGARVKIKGAKVYVDSAPEVETNDQGAFTFSVRNAFPRWHRVSVAPPDVTGQFDAYWFGPWPLHSLSEDRVDFRYDPAQPADKRFSVARNGNVFRRALAAVSGVVVAAAPGPAPVLAEPAAAVAVSDAEAGFIVEAVNTPNLKGLAIFRAKRAFFKVWIDGKELQDREMAAAAPRTLGKNANVFPVQSNRQSWIPVGDKAIRFANLFCRLPPAAISRIAQSNHVVFERDIVVQLVSGDGGDMLGQFVLTRKVPYAIGQSVELADTLKLSSALRIRPVVGLKAIDLKWTPDNGKVTGGQSLALTVAATEPLPFPVEFSLTQSGTGNAAVQNLPRTLTLVPGSGSATLNLRFAAEAGRVKIVSHLPASLKRPGDDDDADVVVMARR